jgi:CheY-like chemotaxis protein
MKKILVVDDEKEIAKLIQERLSQEKKFSVFTASGAQEALDICKTQTPDLILLDIAMPEMDGYTLCEKLRKEKNTMDTPVLFLTGKDLEPQGIIERCEGLGVCGYVSKNSTLKELIEKIEEVTNVPPKAI